MQIQTPAKCYPIVVAYRGTASCTSSNWKSSRKVSQVRFFGGFPNHLFRKATKYLRVDPDVSCQTHFLGGQVSRTWMSFTTRLCRFFGQKKKLACPSPGTKKHQRVSWLWDVSYQLHGRSVGIVIHLAGYMRGYTQVPSIWLVHRVPPMDRGL